MTKKRLTQFETYQLMRDEILEHFDFQKCHKTMKLLGWTWGFDNRVPQIEDLKKTAVHLMESAAKGCLESKSCKPNETYLSSTGGLKAEAIKNKYNQIEYLNLEFVLTDWSTQI